MPCCVAMHHLGFIINQVFWHTSETFMPITCVILSVHGEMEVPITLDGAHVKWAFIASYLVQHFFLVYTRDLFRKRVIVETNGYGRNLGMVQRAVLCEPMHAVVAVQKFQNGIFINLISFAHWLFKNRAVKVAVICHNNDFFVDFVRIVCHEYGN